MPGSQSFMPTSNHDTEMSEKLNRRLGSTTIIAITSGKGGVGKTTISLALGYELASGNNNVAIIDCDLTNRGFLELASGHWKPSSTSALVPDTFVSADSSLPTEWSILELRPGLTTLEVPPLTPAGIGLLESQPFEQIQSAIGSLVSSVVDATRAGVVILDCHGARDAFSLAAASISDHLLVVSVPETITFFGTVQFMRTFKEHYNSERPEASKVQCHILLNNVLEGFSVGTLSHWYRRHFAKYFDDHDFISVIPFDPKVSIATSDELFPTRRFYYSGMAERVRLLALDLLGNDKRVRISDEARFVSRFVRPLLWTRESVFHTIMDQRIPLHFLIVIALALFCGVLSSEIWANVFDATHIMMMSSFWMLYSFIWFGCASISRAALNHDALACSELSRGKLIHKIKACYRALCVVLGVFGLVLAYLFFELVNIDETKRLFDVSSSIEGAFVIATRAFQAVTILSTVPFFLTFVVRFVRTCKFRLRGIETLYRFLVLAVGGVVSYSILEAARSVVG